MKGIDTILFDLGGVLIDLDRDASVRAFERMGFPEAEQLLDPYLQSGIFLRLESGTATPEELYEYVRQRAGEQATSEKVDAALAEFLVDIPQYKLDMLLDLKKRYRVCMLSNTNPIMFHYAVRTWFEKDGHRLEDYFEQCFLSYELKAVKPDPSIFHKIIGQGRVDPARTLFIDDGKANVDAAAALGFQTYFAQPGEDFRGIFTE
ncbi:MAG: HAD family phosphatase [Rikenellaceae bacterium]|jgi:putative hydrolase of the HAD superfamily|nr:HAD family phosphatase [Rikenellaceae bacterium]